MLDLPPDDMRARLFECLAVERWVDDVMQFAPFDSFDRLYESARWAAEFTPAELDEALTEHPRIGERPAGEGQAHQFSRAEQASSDADDAAVNSLIAEGNAAYERRFDRVFLIRAKGRSRAEILAELGRRLALDPDAELANVGSELRDITLLRLTSLFEQQS